MLLFKIVLILQGPVAIDDQNSIDQQIFPELLFHLVNICLVAAKKSKISSGMVFE